MVVGQLYKKECFMLGFLFNKRKFDLNADRLGPDLPFTHWRLYFKPLMLKLCKKKLQYFADTAEIRPGVYVVACSKVSLGQRVSLRPGTMLFADPRENGAGITIEDDVLIGSSVHFYVNNHCFDDTNKPIIDQGHYPSKPILVKRGAWIGAASVILPGVVIGRNAVVGAGAVVTKSVPDSVVVVGSPARIVKYLK